MERSGRKEPYHPHEIVELACVHCGKPARFQWNICSDYGLHRPLCTDCDVIINRFMLAFFNDPDKEEKLEEYIKRLEDEFEVTVSEQVRNDSYQSLIHR